MGRLSGLLGAPDGGGGARRCCCRCCCSCCPLLPVLPTRAHTLIGARIAVPTHNSSNDDDEESSEPEPAPASSSSSSSSSSSPASAAAGSKKSGSGPAAAALKAATTALQQHGKVLGVAAAATASAAALLGLLLKRRGGRRRQQQTRQLHAAKATNGTAAADPAGKKGKKRAEAAAPAKPGPLSKLKPTANVVPLADGSLAVVRRPMAADNSCLFNSVGYCMHQSKSRAPFLRRVVSNEVSGDPDTWSAAFLGMPNAAYCSWINEPQNWGGGIELAILAAHYRREIAAWNIETGEPHVFGEERGEAWGGGGWGGGGNGCSGRTSQSCSELPLCFRQPSAPPPQPPPLNMNPPLRILPPTRLHQAGHGDLQRGPLRRARGHGTPWRRQLGRRRHRLQPADEEGQDDPGGGAAAGGWLLAWVAEQLVAGSTLLQ
jgi:hypothetical protein